MAVQLTKLSKEIAAVMVREDRQAESINLSNQGNGNCS